MIPDFSRVVVVTPVYEDKEAASRLFRELDSVFGTKLCIVAIDDGSVRAPLNGEEFKSLSCTGRILILRRNVGHQRAISIGLGFVAEHMQTDQQVVVMDSDGEDVPATIPLMLEMLQENTVDIIVAQRKSRVETLRFKLFYEVYKCMFKLMTGRAISFGNFMALKCPAVKRLASMQEIQVHVAAATLASKLRIHVCPLDRGPRYAGQSKMNFVGLTLHGFRALMVFAEDVLVRVGMLCGMVAAISSICAIIAVVLRLIGFATPGWFSVAFGILVLMLLQTGTLALMMLMLTGVMRSGTVNNLMSYREFIEKVLGPDGEKQFPG